MKVENTDKEKENVKFNYNSVPQRNTVLYINRYILQ